MVAPVHRDVRHDVADGALEFAAGAVAVANAARERVVVRGANEPLEQIGVLGRRARALARRVSDGHTAMRRRARP